MILWSILNPQYKYAMWVRIGLKIMEFYIIWSTYGAIKLFEGVRKVRDYGIKFFKKGKGIFKVLKCMILFWGNFVNIYSLEFIVK